MIEPLTELIGTFLEADSSLTWGEIADALWLAQFLPSVHPKVPELLDHKSSEVDQDSSTANIAQNGDAENQSVGEQRPDVSKEPEKLYPKLEPLEIDASSSNFHEIPADTVRIAAGQALPNQRAIELALRPLKRRVPSSEFELNEEATGQLNAELRRLKLQSFVLMLQPVQQRWLEVALVVDNSNSMIIWQDTARELGHLLTRQGFQDVRMWHLITQTAAPGILPFKPKQPAALSQPACKLPNIHDRQLILVLTDCVGLAWQNNSAFRLLAEWSDKTSVTLLQVWPEHLWDRTALGSLNTLIKNKIEPTTSIKVVLQVKQYQRWFDLFEQDTSKEQTRKCFIPIVRLESGAFAKWARVITKSAPDWLPAIAIEVAASAPVAANMSDTKASDSPADEPDDEPFDPYRQVEMFRATAAPLTQKLAGLLASVPLTLPIIRLVQNALLPKSELLHLSEFLTSGLVYRVVSEKSKKSGAEQILFEFYEGVRILLRRTVAIPDTVDVLNKVGDFIQNRERRGQTFEALAPNAAGTDLLILNDQTLSFAHLHLRAEVLDSLGPIYRPEAQRLWQQISELTFEFDIVEFVEAAELLPQFELKTFEFETVTANAQGKIIQRSPHAASYYEEALGDVPLQMVAIPGGEFLMGSPDNEPKRSDDEGPQHKVTVPPFFMGKYQVTQAQWRFVAGLPQKQRSLKPDPSRFKGDDLPVERVSWNDVMEFCDRLSHHTGRKYRLPSEAEWEYACRAGTTTPFHFGETITAKLGNYDASRRYREEPEGKYREKTTPVGSFTPNAFGLYDMHGNVREWCADRWHGDYTGAPTDGRAWLPEKRSPDSETEENLSVENAAQSERKEEKDSDNQDETEIQYVLRGGSWGLFPENCRSAYRYRYYPDFANLNLGFRVVSSASRT